MKFSGIERRDPYSGLLTLGSVLCSAHKAGHCGEVEVRDRGQVHRIEIIKGSINAIVTDGCFTSCDEALNRVMHSTQRLFGLPRPHVIWEESSRGRGPVMIAGRHSIDPESVVVKGVMRNQEIFDPVKLVDRIPINTLCLDSSAVHLLRQLSFGPAERAFLERLFVPTPIPMILWKRGLNPKHAAALLVALNLVGVWKNQWNPGDLPRLTTANAISKKIAASASDHYLLGISDDAGDSEIDRAFRLLSMELHPDRMLGMPSNEVAAAQTAFSGVTAAYGRIKNSRRSRPVQNLGKVNLVKRSFSKSQAMLMAARDASERGEHEKAKTLALKGLAASPTAKIKMELVQIIRRAA